MELKTIYRIEHPDDNDGMWYSGEGILKKKIHILCPNGIAKDFPMPFNSLHQKDGKRWKSAGKSIENMNQWFTAEDALSLNNYGFKLYEFKTYVYQELEMEILFVPDEVLSKRKIPLNQVWDIHM
jgi:hypothetical protein